MPQFDSATFFSQLFWFLLIFYSFYIVIFRSYLPGLTRILKLRRKSLEKASSVDSPFTQEEQNLRASLDDLLNNFVSQSQELLGQHRENLGLALEKSLLESQEGRASLDKKYFLNRGLLRGQKVILKEGK
jgi:hypothetical protein